MGEEQQARDAVHQAADKTDTEVRLEALQKTLHHIEATKHFLKFRCSPRTPRSDASQSRKAT